MRQSWKHRTDQGGAGSWPAVADMATATCIMLVLFWMAGTWELNKVKAANSGLTKALEGKRIPREDEVIISKADLTSLVKLEPWQEVASSTKILRGDDVAISAADNEWLKKTKKGYPPGTVNPEDSILRPNKVAIDRAELERLRKVKPLIMDLSEMRNFVFDSGKADLSPEFRHNGRRSLFGPDAVKGTGM